MIVQYLEFCQEESFEFLSQVIFYCIFEVCEVFQRKVFKGFDNVVVEGMVVFEIFDKVVEEF